MTATGKAIFSLGGPSKVARYFNISPWAVNMWVRNNKIPAERCPDIELLTKGEIKCEDLRPDVNWSVLRNKKRRTARKG
ncbi:Cro/CI family transcriptional regulator [Testudinibacter sp. P80/BLE/0925]|uniref:Cro/CI family transcriptional regulator n=1 Tax=Testudinibacter sp. TW-1 TaxID=3417757 RepID=UPI003D36A758